MYRVLEALRWEVPDWIVVPGGNLGNSSAFGKAFARTLRAGPDRPRAAAGGDQRRRGQHALRAGRATRPALERRPAGRIARQPLLRRHGGRSSAAPRPSPAPLRSTGRSTCKSACGRWNGAKAWSARSTDQEILDAKAQVGAGGMGCEPASAASVAGAKRLRGRRRHRARRARGLHPHRPSTQGPHRHGRLSRDRPRAIRTSIGQPWRPPRGLCQPARHGAERAGQDRGRY